MKWLGNWIFSLGAAALVASLAQTLCPKGTGQKLVELAGALLLLVAVLQPLKLLLGADFSALLADCQATYSSQGTYGDTDLTKSIIEEQTAAYISDKAKILGIQACQVEVVCGLTPEGFPTPEGVRVQGQGSQDAWDALSRAITIDFGLGTDCQELERTDAP